MIRTAANSQRKEIIQLLQGENLPVTDLPASLDNFFVTMENDKVIGAIGLELYTDCGLLRSMIVSRDHRNKNIASGLIRKLEEFARTSGINTMYLLTETADKYFERQGYQKINRDDVPEELKVSSEFSHLCPATAFLMKKELN